MPESPDFQEIARQLALNHGERQNIHFDVLDESLQTAEDTQSLQGDIAEQLCLVWNARGAADIAKLEMAHEAHSPPAMETLDHALRALDC